MLLVNDVYERKNSQHIKDESAPEHVVIGDLPETAHFLDCVWVLIGCEKIYKEVRHGSYSWWCRV